MSQSVLPSSTRSPARPQRQSPAWISTSAWRWLVFWLVVSAAPTLFLRIAVAQPCSTPRLATGALVELGQRWRTPPPKPIQPSRWRGLVPSHVAWRLRDTARDGMGWYVNPTTGTTSQTGLTGNTTGWSVQVRWDLRALFLEPTPPRKQRVARLLGVDKLLQRIAAHGGQLNAIDEQAKQLSLRSQDCAPLQRRAALIAATIEALCGPSAGLIARRAAPRLRPTDEPRAPRSEALPRPRRGSRP